MKIDLRASSESDTFRTVWLDLVDSKEHKGGTVHGGAIRAFQPPGDYPENQKYQGLGPVSDQEVTPHGCDCSGAASTVGQASTPAAGLQTRRGRSWRTGLRSLQRSPVHQQPRPSGSGILD